MDDLLDNDIRQGRRLEHEENQAANRTEMKNHNSQPADIAKEKRELVAKMRGQTSSENSSKARVEKKHV